MSTSASSSETTSDSSSSVPLRPRTRSQRDSRTNSIPLPFKSRGKRTSLRSLGEEDDSEDAEHPDPEAGDFDEELENHGNPAGFAGSPSQRIESDVGPGIRPPTLGSETVFDDSTQGAAFVAPPPGMLAPPNTLQNQVTPTTLFTPRRTLRPGQNPRTP
ncbi:hypothetical protein C0992_001023 [Termitomyces sp. T32_za158]|nr:hypothetical protein C0992_001023 [Termitomyces sp. T32_za158]